MCAYVQGGRRRVEEDTEGGGEQTQLRAGRWRFVAGELGSSSTGYRPRPAA